MSPVDGFTVPISLTNIGTVNLSDTTGNALFEVGVAAALEKTPTESLNFHVVGSSIYDDHLLVKTEGAEPAGSHDVIAPSGSTGSGSVAVGALNPATYQNIQSVKLLPTVTVVGLTGALLIGGAIVTETVFGLPGIGNLIVSSVLRRDYPVIQGALIVIAGIYVLINIIIDLIYALVDPRVRV